MTNAHTSARSPQTDRTTGTQSSAGSQSAGVAAPRYGLSFVDRGMTATPNLSSPVQIRIGSEEEELLQGKFAPVESGEPDSAPTPRENHTGLPDRLKLGIESLSGLAMDNVRVHYNSSRPAQLNALAYAQGSDIHVAPGQEKHLPHEAWHVVQQAQGRVQPSTQMKDGTLVNDDLGLEQEASEMGQRSQTRPEGKAHRSGHQQADKFSRARVVQRQPKWKTLTTDNPTTHELNEAAAAFIAKFKNVDLEERGLDSGSGEDPLRGMASILKAEKEKIIAEYSNLDLNGWLDLLSKGVDPIAAIGERLEDAVEAYLPLSLDAVMPETTWQKRFATSLDAVESLIGIGLAGAELGAEALGGVGAQAASIGIDPLITTTFAKLKGATPQSILLQGTIAATCAAIKTPMPIAGEVMSLLGSVQQLGDAMRFVPRIKQMAKGRDPRHLKTRARNMIDERALDWVNERASYADLLIRWMEKVSRSSQRSVILEEEVTKKSRSGKSVSLEEGLDVEIDHHLLRKLTEIHADLEHMNEELLNAGFKTAVKANRAKKQTRIGKKIGAVKKKLTGRADEFEMI